MASAPRLMTMMIRTKPSRSQSKHIISCCSSFVYFPLFQLVGFFRIQVLLYMFVVGGDMIYSHKTWLRFERDLDFNPSFGKQLNLWTSDVSSVKWRCHSCPFGAVLKSEQDCVCSANSSRCYYHQRHYQCHSLSSSKSPHITPFFLDNVSMTLVKEIHFCFLPGESILLILNDHSKCTGTPPNKINILGISLLPLLAF